jgi:hypothetical protein
MESLIHSEAVASGNAQRHTMPLMNMLAPPQQMRESAFTETIKLGIGPWSDETQA